MIRVSASGSPEVHLWDLPLTAVCSEVGYFFLSFKRPCLKWDLAIPSRAVVKMKEVQIKCQVQLDIW